jgi:hypothetical protein
MNVAHHRYKQTNMQMFRTFSSSFYREKDEKACIYNVILGEPYFNHRVE